MTLGKPGVKGDPPDALTEPNDVVTDPSNGDVYVAESHMNVEDPNLVGRISVFDRNGKFLRIIGKTERGQGVPHTARDRVRLSGTADHRRPPQPPDSDPDEGREISAEWREFSRVSGLAIDGNDTIYAADSESDPKRHPGWLKGIRIGSLKDGKVTIFVPPHKTDAPDGAMGEGIAIDSAGNLFTAEATVRGITKYVKE